jgi:predicted NBD/HSP70 family sugar kinase/transcriptional regulator with XRE-family HTH domain
MATRRGRRPTADSTGSYDTDFLRQLIEADPEATAAYEDATVRDGLADAMTAIRKSTDRTQADVATDMNTVQSVISALESGRSPDLYLGTAQRWARALDRRLDIAIVPQDLPSFGAQGLPNMLWALVHKYSLSPILTTLVTARNDPTRRTLAKLANTSKLPEPIVHAILSSLCVRGWVVQDPSSSSNTPSNGIYALRESAATVIGLSFHPKRVEAVLLDTYARVLKHETEHADSSRREDLVSAAVRLTKKLQAAHSQKNLLGVGCSIAGVVEPTTSGVVTFAPHLESEDDDWRNVELERTLQADIQTALDDQAILVAVENDANALALLEYWSTGDSSACVILMSGGGVGSGFLADGSLVRGAHFAAGEGGHMTVVGDDTPCQLGLGHAGCLETVASARGIVERLGLEYSNTAVRELLAICNSRIEEGDEEALGVFRGAGVAIGSYATTLAAVVDSLSIAIWGYPELIQAEFASARAFLEGFEEGWSRARTNEDRYAVPNIVWRPLHQESRAVAAGAAAMRQFLEDPTRWRPKLAPDSVTAAPADVPTGSKTPRLEYV